MRTLSTKSLLNRIAVEVANGNVAMCRDWSGHLGMEITILSTRPDFQFGVHMNFNDLSLADAIDNAETQRDLLGLLGEVRRADLELRSALLEHFKAACRRLGIEEGDLEEEGRSALAEGGTT